MRAAFSVTAFASRLLVGLRYPRTAFDVPGAREYALLYKRGCLASRRVWRRANRLSP